MLLLQGFPAKGIQGESSPPLVSVVPLLVSVVVILFKRTAADKQAPTKRKYIQSVTANSQSMSDNKMLQLV